MKKSLAAWERSWQKHWRRVGQPGYELPAGGDDRRFLTTARTPAREAARLKRITGEFARAFRAFFDVGPAVTVFGSARFKETHKYYKLARAVGAELAKAGFATLAPSKPRVVVVHGEDRQRKALADQIYRRYRLKSVLPAQRETIEL
jgi:hypothetical protein